MEALVRTLRPGELMASVKGKRGRPKGKKESRRFKKGSAEAKAHMAMVRAAGGKKKRGSTAKRAATDDPKATPMLNVIALIQKGGKRAATDDPKATRKHRKAGRPKGSSSSAKKRAGRPKGSSAEKTMSDKAFFNFLGL